MSETTKKPEAQSESAKSDSVQRVVRALLPRCSHARYADPEKLRIEYEPAASCFRATLWIYWTWKCKGHRLLISLPDFVP